jgi:hypothetical protein
MSKQIPFSIHEFTRRGGIGKCKVVTRGGESVRILCTDGPYAKQPIVAFAEAGLEQWSLDGSFYEGGSDNHRLDLFILDESEPKWREWKPSEVPVGQIIVAKDATLKAIITLAGKESNTVGVGTVIFSSDYILQTFTMLDGSPCGVKEEA